MRSHQAPFILREIKIEVTHRCPLACVHCSSNAGPSSYHEMSAADCMSILRQAAGMGVREVVFSGGEPLNWSTIDEAVRFAAGAGFEVMAYTSGHVPDPASRFPSLVDAGLRKAAFSVFGMSSESHEMITRVKGSFDTTLQAVGTAKSAGMQVELHFVPMPDNYRELSGVAAIGRELGASRVSVLRLVLQGRARLFDFALSRLQNLELRRTILNLRQQGYDIRTGSPYNFLLLNDEPACKSGIDRLIVGPDLAFYPCDAFKQVPSVDLIGTSELCSLANATLQECWAGSPYLNAVREYLTTDFAKTCRECGVLDDCLSGCLAQKVLAHGDLAKAPDPMCLLS